MGLIVIVIGRIKLLAEGSLVCVQLQMHAAAPLLCVKCNPFLIPETFQILLHLCTVKITHFLYIYTLHTYIFSSL